MREYREQRGGIGSRNQGVQEIQGKNVLFE